MKKIKTKIIAFALLTAFAISCSSQHKIHGSAADRTGTNGATNGTGKIPKSL